MIIEYYKKENYGTLSLYIKDEQQAKTVQTLTNRKTLSKDDIKALESLGVAFKEVLRP